MNKLHPSLQVKDVVIKEDQGFRLRIKSWKCVSPADLTSLEFIQESLKEDGTIAQTSTYSFFMYDDELKKLAESLV